MSPVDRELNPAKPLIGDLKVAVARWEYEGGAEVTGPQEGFRVDDLPNDETAEPKARKPRGSGSSR